MKISREQKKQNAVELMMQIDKCHSEEDIERVGDILEEYMFMGGIYKRHYEVLCEELDCRLCDIVNGDLLRKKRA